MIPVGSVGVMGFSFVLLALAQILRDSIAIQDMELYKELGGKFFLI